MNLFKKLSTGFTGLALVMLVVAGNGGVASAACNWNYTGNAMTTTSTPVFNSICGVPGSIGDESDFLRIRPGQSGGVSNANAATNILYSNSLNAACNNGDRFDIRTYIHNDAEPQHNAGAGTGIARNTTVGFTTPVNSQSSSFNFASRIAASNAPGVNDTASLSCNGAPVTLRLVPSSAKIYHETSSAWTNVSDSFATGTSTIGDTVGGNSIRGCWDFRVLVGFTVEVVRETTPTVASGTCDLLTIGIRPNRTVTIEELNSTMSNSTMNSVVINWGDGKSDTFTTLAAAKAASHQYPKTDTVKIYVITATMSFTGGGRTFTSGGVACSTAIKYTPQDDTTIVTPPPTTPEAPTTLVNAGAGSTIAMFSAVTAFGALAHRRFLARRLGN